MWKTVKLKDVCSVFTDGDWIETKDQSAEGIRLVQTGNVKTGSFADRKEKARYISDETFKRLNCTEVMEGDILVSRLPEPVGRACIIPKLQEKAITAVDCTVIRTKEDVLPTYLNYYMQSPQYFFLVQEKVTGATRQRISRKNLGDVLVNLPPLAEQQRIVAKLDAAFAEIDRAIEVVSEQLRNSSDLYSAILTEKLNRLKKDTRLGECCSFLNGYAFKSNEAVEETDVQLLRMGNLYNNVLDLERKPVFYPSEFAQHYSKYVINSGDIVMTLTGTVGKQDYGYAIKVPETDKTLLLNQRILKLHNFDDSRVNQDFLLYVLRSHSFLSELYSTANGTRQANLSSETIKNLKMPLPSITVQNELVRSLQSIELANAAYYDAINHKATQLLTLKSSILAQELQPPQSEAA